MTQSREDRDELVLRHLAVARSEAFWFWSRIGSAGQARHDFDDLHQIATEGLMRAATRFDPARGSDFKRYAQLLIRGAIADYLRDQDHLSRDIRKLRVQIHAARWRLEQRIKREPSTDEISAEMGMTPEKFGAAITKLGGWLVMSLDELTEYRPAEGDHGKSLSDLAHTADPAPTADDEAAGFWQDRRTSEAVAKLLPREREVLYATFVEGDLLRDVARRWELTESRACQVRRSAIRKLRVLLTDA